MFEGAPIPANWEAFLRSNANKDELFRYLSDCIHACETGRKVIISTNDETIVSTQNNMSDVEYLQPCSHEEADTCILLHVEHCARQGLRKLVIRTVDTYVVVLEIGHFPALRLDELWVRFGTGTHFRQIAIQEIVKNINDQTNQAKRHCCNMCDARHSKRDMCGHGRLLQSLSCLVLHIGGGSHPIRGGNPFGLN